MSLQDSVPVGTPILVVANKVDLRSDVEERQEQFVTAAEGAQLAAVCRRRRLCFTVILGTN